MKKVDLTGNRYGILTVLGENPVPYVYKTGKKVRRWDCRCDCGKELTMLQNYMIKAKSCGCLRTQQKNMIGLRFGRLTVLKIVKLPRQTRNGQKNGWLCRCDCGNEVITTRKELLSGKKSSCGCLLKEVGSKKTQEDNIFGFFEGTAISNIKSSKPRSGSESGYRGIRIKHNKSGEKYIARITIKGKNIHLGSFDSLEEAIKARKDGERKYFQPIIEKYTEEKNY